MQIYEELQARKSRTNPKYVTLSIAAEQSFI